MRAYLGLTLVALLSMDVLPGSCGSEPDLVGPGETCGGYTSQPRECGGPNTCCQPDPRIADKPGTCVRDNELAHETEACGVTSGRCCASPTHCEVHDHNAGDGVCVR